MEKEDIYPNFLELFISGQLWIRVEPGVDRFLLVELFRLAGKTEHASPSTWGYITTRYYSFKGETEHSFGLINSDKDEGIPELFLDIESIFRPQASQA